MNERDKGDERRVPGRAGGIEGREREIYISFSFALKQQLTVHFEYWAVHKKTTHTNRLIVSIRKSMLRYSSYGASVHRKKEQNYVLWKNGEVNNFINMR